MDRIVVVGASAAGLTAADTLRREGFTGTLTMVGEEPHLPYDRPPLSKQVLAGDWQPHRTTLRSAADLQRLQVDLRQGCRAVGLDPIARTVTLADGERLGYDGLIIATGLRPRRLPFGHDLAGVHVLRTLDDALALRAELLAGPRLVVIGAGFLGSEIAATGRGLGLDVVLVDVEPTPLARQVGTWVGELVADLHHGHGVRLQLRRRVASLTGERGRVTAVVLDDGTRLPADAVVVAIGSVPATDWLAGSGIPLGDGVLCDHTCRAAPGVYAAGDVANWPHPTAGGRVRLEQRTNATQQAVTAAKNLLAGPDGATRFTPTPFGWTDQYDTKIQIHGWAPADSQVDGSTATRRRADSSPSTARTAGWWVPSAGTAHARCSTTASGSPTPTPHERTAAGKSGPWRRRTRPDPRTVQPHLGRHHALPIRGNSHPHSLAGHGMRTTATGSLRGLWRAGCDAKSHARFGKRLRGNGPVERPEPRPRPTSPATQVSASEPVCTQV